MSSYSPFFRQLVITLHLGMIAREIWKYCTTISTTVAAAAPANKASSKRDVQVHPVELNDQEEQQPQLASSACIQDNEDFYVKRADWEYFRDVVEREVAEEGTGNWEIICDKSTDQLEYTAYRRTLPVSPPPPLLTPVPSSLFAYISSSIVRPLFPILVVLSSCRSSSLSRPLLYPLIPFPLLPLCPSSGHYIFSRSTSFHMQAPPL